MLSIACRPAQSFSLYGESQYVVHRAEISTSRSCAVPAAKFRDILHQVLRLLSGAKSTFRVRFDELKYPWGHYNRWLLGS